MLNPFPELLTYSLLGPFLLRIILAFIFVNLGILKFRGEKERWIASFETLGLRPTSLFVPLYGLLQVIGGILLLIGLWTQVAVLAFVIFTGIELYIEWKAGKILKRDLVFYLLLFVISLSLLLTGAGAFAIDIPL
ncbi:MAG: hypothetical protein COV96_00900 [Candidatus Zambryskibacteria bacterium CG11_big_fil_rev_8_21_14_0_20_42_18]|uniref:DoxX family protein n=1 Tax=Candidatus Zambryskibacteria bacterium CG_4_9_14_3_um_filter_42_15 TaxID=1975112 RepID=A0A2M7WSK4_9BACT|nr:MAG: hypothetical protein COV96_00900 [Candidatus Zambryskibacteria bacterium CG11_big_fil_rev_8_21_14_0_20_42_18]PJA32990.1 MAG: hypothetical protein CO185_00990 [Candidatus Zambryskibacteria bacterium CG_4_9_14_3_um_filter_42_15]